MLKLEKCRIANGGFALTADFEVIAGTKIAVIGPSGGGKSTLLEAVAGFLPLKTGRIVWDGKTLQDKDPGARPVAMLFQDGNLFPHLTAEQNVGLGMNPNLKLDEDAHRKVLAALARVGLDGMSNRRSAELSGGQQSRVALARVLVQERALLLMDEPFAALGPAQKMEMLDLVSELCAETGSTALMVSHDPGDAKHFADQVILVHGGIAHAPQETGELFRDPPEALRTYLG